MTDPTGRGEQLSLDITPPHRNHYLLSDYYLNHLLPQEARWAAALPVAQIEVPVGGRK